MRLFAIASAVVLIAAAAQSTLPPTGSGVLSGTLMTDAATPQPVRRATVRLAGGGQSARLVGTDEQGRFTFDALPAASYSLSASKPGFVTVFHGEKRPGRGP